MRVLVVGPAWVGDMVMAQSLFITLKQRGDVSAVDVLAPAWSLPLLARMPEVRCPVVLPTTHGQFGLSPRWRLGRALRSKSYDQAIVLPRSLKAALVPFFAAVPRRTGYRGEMRYGLINDMRTLDKAALPQVVQRYVNLGLAPGATLPAELPQPRLRIDEENRAALTQSLGLDTSRPAIVFMPGAEYGPAKRWPLMHYRELARQLVASGYQVWVLGSAKERLDGESVGADNAGVINLCGHTRLEDTIDLLSLAVAAVSNDSGLMHVAAAVGIPLVAIYGSSSPHYTPPLSSAAAIVYRGLDCSPCFERNCPIGDTPCLTEIAPQSVRSALDNLLDEHDHAED